MKEDNIVANHPVFLETQSGDTVRMIFIRCVFETSWMDIQELRFELLIGDADQSFLTTQFADHTGSSAIPCYFGLLGANIPCGRHRVGNCNHGNTDWRYRWWFRMDNDPKTNGSRVIMDNNCIINVFERVRIIIGVDLLGVIDNCVNDGLLLRLVTGVSG